VNQFAVIGLGGFGLTVARTLAEAGCQVIAIDIDQEQLRQVEEYVTYAVQLDAGDRRALEEVGVAQVDTAVVAIGSNFEASIMATLNLKELGVPLVICKAVTPRQGKILERVGADRVVFPEQDLGRRLAQTLTSPTIFDHIELSPDYSIEEIRPPADFVGKSLRDLDLRARFGLNVIGIRREKKEPRLGSPLKELDIAPTADAVIREGDTLLVIGPNSSFEELTGKG
jgi:trk system potassium uptake protein TrkA